MTRFEITMNSRTINNRTNFMTSVFAHELGHAAGLADNPAGTAANDSLMNHARNRDIVLGPTAFDIQSVRILYDGFIPPARAFAPVGRMEEIVVMGDYPHYTDINNLASAASDVVRVEVLSERVEKLNVWLETPPAEIDPYMVYTIYTVRVIDSYFGGAAPGDIIEVRQLGGQLDDTLVVNADKTPMAVGDDLVLFLRASAIEDYPHVLVNPQQSAFVFEDTSGALDGAHPDNDLTLTIEILEQIGQTTIIPGDVNRDGQVTAADVGMLRAYLAGFPVDICRQAADVNGDGRITAADVGLLRAYLAGFPVVLQGS